jgi:hypothetical protein
MTLKLEIDPAKLMPWYYAANWAGMLLEQHLNQCKALEMDCSMHEERLAQLEDLKQFLSMTFDEWIHSPVMTQEVEK